MTTQRPRTRRSSQRIDRSARTGRGRPRGLTRFIRTAYPARGTRSSGISHHAGGPITPIPADGSVPDQGLISGPGSMRGCTITRPAALEVTIRMLRYAADGVGATLKPRKTSAGAKSYTTLTARGTAARAETTHLHYKEANQQGSRLLERADMHRGRLSGRNTRRDMAESTCSKISAR